MSVRGFILMLSILKIQRYCPSLCFLLPGESLEETVQREVAEEVGLEVKSLWYSASQHWPFPNSILMIACHALVHPLQSKVRTLVESYFDFI